MKILLISIGTRGDMEPFLAIGQIMKEKGHDVTCLFPEQFRNIAEESGLKFESLGSEFIEMTESDLGKFALGGGGSKLKKLRAYGKLSKIQNNIGKDMLQRQINCVEAIKPDRILHHAKAFYPLAWELSNPNKTILVSPIPYVLYIKGKTHSSLRQCLGSFKNKIVYSLSNWAMAKYAINTFKHNKTIKASRKQIKRVVKSHKTIYTISPQLFDVQSYWHTNNKILGYYERNRPMAWNPSPELQSFLGKHNKIVLVSFGSMTNPNSKEKTRIILDILNRNNIPAIINTSSGGLEKPSTYNKSLFYFVDNIPYNWILPKMYAAIHHGGSGTTHMAAKYACPSLIIPHITDQYIWNKIVYEKGLGPKGIEIGSINTKNLEAKVLDLMNNRQYKQNAIEIANAMKHDVDLREQLCKEILKGQY